MLLVVSFFASSVLMNVLGWLSPGNSLTNHFTFCITLFQQADFFLPAGVNSLHFIAGRYIAVNFRFSWGGDRPGPVDGWYGWGWEADQAERCYLSFIFGILDCSVCTHEDLENNFVCIWKRVLILWAASMHRTSVASPQRSLRQLTCVGVVWCNFCRVHEVYVVFSSLSAVQSLWFRVRSSRLVRMLD